MITLFKAALYFLLGIYSAALRSAVNRQTARRIKKGAPLSAKGLVALTGHINSIFAEMASLEEYITHHINKRQCV